MYEDYALHEYENIIKASLGELEEKAVVRRIWEKDPTVWSENTDDEIINRLGWLDLPYKREADLEEIIRVGDAIIEKNFKSIILLGMGGSSLAPEMFQEIFGNSKSHPRLYVLDSTHPNSIINLRESISLPDTLFIVASKSGTTIETISFFYYFWDLIKEINNRSGEQFIAITDPATPLEKMAEERGFFHIFHGPEDVGGRYSAFSVFGLVPAYIIGCDIKSILVSANQMGEKCKIMEDLSRNPGALLGTVMGELANRGLNKLTIFTSPSLSALPYWIEQLVAESTGKDGKGILPVIEEPFDDPDVYSRDRLFVYMFLEKEKYFIEKHKKRLIDKGYPVVSISLSSLYEIGGELFRWEMAVAIAGAVIGIQPFDQPDVQLAKELAKNAMRGGTKDFDNIEGIGVSEKERLRIALNDFFNKLDKGMYIAVQAYLPRNLETKKALEEIQKTILDRYHVPVTTGYGPRFLHSTGQFHKGGPNEGLFIQIIDDPSIDIEVPEQNFTFKKLIKAQATGDFMALKKRKREIIRINLGKNSLQDLAILEEIIKG